MFCLVRKSELKAIKDRLERLEKDAYLYEVENDIALGPFLRCKKYTFDQIGWLLLDHLKVSIHRTPEIPSSLVLKPREEK